MNTNKCRERSEGVICNVMEAGGGLRLLSAVRKGKQKMKDVATRRLHESDTLR